MRFVLSSKFGSTDPGRISNPRTHRTLYPGACAAHATNCAVRSKRSTGSTWQPEAASGCINASLNASANFLTSGEEPRRLEYRGYDSAGIAALVNKHIECRRAEGKLANLARRLGKKHSRNWRMLAYLTVGAGAA